MEANHLVSAEVEDLGDYLIPVLAVVEDLGGYLIPVLAVVTKPAWAHLPKLGRIKMAKQTFHQSAWEGLAAAV